ncbi:MAG: hypothetical protein GY828_02585 [Candidatus Gracilibacteria bacterium]|nr:hypothetical protein [Candidatus Gracilibacteria bacterium]
MQYNKSLEEIYQLYQQEKFIEAKELNDELLRNDPTNIYAKRYENLLQKQAKKIVEPIRKGPIPTVQGKSLKCPHCTSKIALSALTKEQKEKIREKKFNNLLLKCPYCHTEFTLQEKKARSILGIKLGETITYKQKQYRTVGYVQYRGIWYEGVYSGIVEYLEWILLGNDNSYLYFSEGFSRDDGKKIYEFDFSYKGFPKDPLSVDFNQQTFTYKGETTGMDKYSKVTVRSVYGENSKSFCIGESVISTPVIVSGTQYVYEKETSGTQTEVGIYVTESVNMKQAMQIFQKETTTIPRDLTSDYLVYMLGLLGLFFVSLFLPIPQEVFINIGLFLIYLAVILSIWYKILMIYLPQYEAVMKKIVLLSMVGPLFSYFFIIPIGNQIIEGKKQMSIEDFSEGKKYEIHFQSDALKNSKITSTSKYDYGGTRTYYEEKEGIKFSVKDDKTAQEIREKIKENPESGMGKIFEGILYKLK